MNKKDYLNQQIKLFYATEESEALAKRLGISLSNLRVKAKRLGVKRGLRTITNEIINGEKLCPKCCKVLPVEDFNKDKYQPNKIDYWCRECRNKTKNNLKVKPTNKPKKNNSLAFSKKKTRNPVIMINGILSLKCKSCKKYKPVDDFHIDNRNISKHKNFCKVCISKKKKGII